MSESGESGGGGPDRPDVGGTGPGGKVQGQRPSGLRNPAAAVRGVGAAALGAEGVGLLLAIVPLRVLDAGGNAGTTILVTLALVCFVLVGLLRHRWAWWAASAVPVAALACGFVVHLSLTVLGVLFGLIWLYVLRVRATVLGGR